MLRLQGQFPPIPTPFRDGRVSTDDLRSNLERWQKEPLAGYVVLGSNGEAPLLDDGERREVISAARAAIPEGERLMIVGTGRETTEAAIRSTREAFDLGADGVLVGVPTYYKPAMTDPVLETYYRAVADASPGPVLLYSVPGFTGIPLSPSLVGSLATHERIVGIKDSGGDTENLSALVEAGRKSKEPFAVLVGSARILADALLSGACGAVLAVASIAPRICDGIFARVLGGDPLGAREATTRLAPLAAAVTREHGIGGLKAALDLLGYAGGSPRPPLPLAGEEARKAITSRLKEMGLLK